MRSVYKRHTRPSDLVPAELFDGIVKTLNAAISDDFTAQYPDLCETLRNNNEVFAAFKVHDQCERMAKLLTDDDGKLKTFEQWVREAEPISNHHNKVWLRTEYDTAIKRAAQAREWRQFEDERDVLPNLRWVPSTAAKPGADHMVFWDVVRPIDDPFWSQHKPGDRWGCQCSLEATDDPVTPVPPSGVTDEPAPGLDGNPATTGKLFSDSHPYYPSSCGTCPFNTGSKQPSKPRNEVRECFNCPYYIDCKPIQAKRRKAIFSEAKEVLPSIISNAHIDNVHITNAAIKEWLNQPHKHYSLKNELLLDIEKVFKAAKEVAKHPPVKDAHREKGIIMQYFFEISILEDKSWIIVDEFMDGSRRLHSITDSPKAKR